MKASVGKITEAEKCFGIQVEPVGLLGLILQQVTSTEPGFF